MESQTARHVAELRGQMGELRAALGSAGPDEAAKEIRRLRQAVELLEGYVADLQSLAPLQDAVASLQGTVSDLQGSVTALQIQVAAFLLFSEKVPVPVPLTDSGKGADGLSVTSG